MSIFFKSGLGLWARLALMGVLWVTGRPSLAAKEPELADFGYQHMNVNGKLAIGTRPLLIILASFKDSTNTVASEDVYADRFFSPQPKDRPRSVNGFFQAMSNHRFEWASAGVIRHEFTSQDYLPKNPSTGKNDDGAYSSNLASNTMYANSFDLDRYDADHDQRVTSDELSVLIITGEWPMNGGHRACNPFKLPGSSVTYAGAVIWIGPEEEFATICHETCHDLGTLDIYGADYNRSPWLTVMGGGRPWPKTGTFYLDPWHRMQLGWCEPRIFSLIDGGLARIPAAQAGDTSAPIILYDPYQGQSDYLILEYRTSQFPGGGGYDTDVAGNGLAIWWVRQDANHDSYVTDAGDRSVLNAGPPGMLRDSGTLWGGESLTRPLSVLGLSAPARIHVWPFTVGDRDLAVEWGLPDAWVDFAYEGGTERGSSDRPFKTLDKGVEAVLSGGTMHLRAGHTPEARTITKAMCLQAEGGPVSIGF